MNTLAQNAINEWDLSYRRGEISLIQCREGIARILAAEAGQLV